MKPLADLGPNDCRYPVGDELPEQHALAGKLPHARHLFCGAPGRPYCATHRLKAYSGPGKPWQSLAEMIRHTEQSVTVVSDGYGETYPTEASRDLVEIARDA